jgi:hypothetical protein
MNKLRNIVAAIIVGGGGLFVSENMCGTTSPSSFITQAEARLGRPGTPLSVAGVARRHYRRAAVAGAVVGGALAGGYGYGYGYGYEAGYPYSSYASSSYPDYGYGYSNYGYSYPSYGTYGYSSNGYPYSYASYGWRRWWW